MATASETPIGEELAEPPEFDLECLFDDPSNPSQLTVFSPETRRLTTEWLTVDRAAAVSLDRVR